MVCGSRQPWQLCKETMYPSFGSHGCHGIKCHGSHGCHGRYVKKPRTLLLEAMAAMAPESLRSHSSHGFQKKGAWFLYIAAMAAMASKRRVHGFFT